MLGSLVASKEALRGSRVSAHIAVDNRRLLRVGLHVVVETALLVCPVVADGAHVGLLSRVNKLVLLEVAVLLRAEIALVALVRFLTCVLSHVHLL